MLKIGDIILISDPNNEILNDQVFLIEYIDPTKINLFLFQKSVLRTRISLDFLIMTIYKSSS
jgi:hypothetical protein